MNLQIHKTVIISVLVTCTLVFGASVVHAVTIENSIESTAHTGGQTSRNGADGKDGADGRDGRDGISGADGSHSQNGSASATVHIESYVNGEEVTNITRTEESENGESVSANAEIHIIEENTSEEAEEIIGTQGNVTHTTDTAMDLDSLLSRSHLVAFHPVPTTSLATQTSTTTIETESGLKKFLATIHVTLFSYVEKFF